MHTAVHRGIAAGPLRFDVLTMADGLSQNAAHCTVQDTQGFIWIATQEGLNRYDGITCRVYTYDSEDPRSLSSSNLTALFVDSRAGLWAGTYEAGLNRYDARHDCFERIALPDEHGIMRNRDRIYALCEHPRGVLWVARSTGLVRIDLANDSMRQIAAPRRPGAGSGRTTVNAMGPGRNGDLLLGTQHGLFVLRAGSEVAEHIDYVSPDRRDLPDEFWISCFTRRNENELWMSSHHSLYSLSLADYRAQRVDARPAEWKDDKPLVITALIRSSPSELWLSSLHGVYCYNEQTGKVHRIVHEAGVAHSLAHNTVEHLYLDTNATLWLATRNGVNQLHLRQRKFRLHTYQGRRAGSLPEKYVNALAGDGKGRLWIGTPNGLYCYDIRKDSYTRLGAEDAGANALSHQYIIALCFASDAKLWIGTQVGLNVYDPATGSLRYYLNTRGLDVPPDFPSHRVINSIIECADGVLCIGTQGGGVNFLLPDRKTFCAYTHKPGNSNGPGDNLVLAVAATRAGTIWLGTATGGANSFDRATQTFRHYRHEAGRRGSLSSNTVLAIHEDAAGRLWLGTTRGLNLAVVQKDGGYSFLHFGMREGLPNDVIYGIEEDAGGNLWLSTNRGLARFTYTNDKTGIRNFDPSDGLQDNEFNLNAHYRAPDGTLYFGGPNGFNSFHPQQLTENTSPPPVVFTDFKVLNKSVPVCRPGERQTAEFSLPQSISSLRHLRLSYRESVLSIEFAALNYINPHKNRYAYKLEGFDNDWVESGNRNFATYTNLDAGRYTLRVRAANNDGVWNYTGAALGLDISPPPWQSWWAYGLYAISGMSGVVAYTRHKVRERARELEAQARVERARVDEREKIRRKNAADFHDEAGNKLTRIMLYTELAKRQTEDRAEVNGLLHKIEENAAGLSGGMRDFIWVLDPERDSLRDTLIRLEDFAASLFQYTAVDLSVRYDDAEVNGVNLPLDLRRQLLLIFKEAMHNCLKHAQCSRALLLARVRNGVAGIAFADNGRGFAVPPATGGYGLNNMRARAGRIGAALALRSAPGKGTEIAVCLKIPQMGN